MQVKRVFANLLFDDKFMRKMLKSAAVLGLASIIGLLNSADVLACASCGCTLSSDWSNQQFAYTPGLRVDMRWDFIDQNQLRRGTGTISPSAASQVMENGSPAEVEKYTRNNYYTLGIDYSKTPDWGVNVQIPFIDRSHSTLGTASDGTYAGPGGGQYDSHTESFGDVKIVGRYQGFIPGCSTLGLLFGVKLPTGSHTETGISTDPTAPGLVPVDRGLQPGTGTTDVIFGAYYTNSITQNLGYFAQVLFQRALYSEDEYTPGEGLNLNLGLRYLGFSGFEPQVQFNFRHVLHDTGAQADMLNTGGTLLYVSPGVSVSVGNNVSIYGFVQVPVYQDVIGIQLAPRATTSLGMRYSF
ncbi:MAG: TonB-dependent receptor [Dissulfurispiraceae bacterium]